MDSSQGSKKPRLIDWTVPLLGLMLVVAFFIAHQALATGFFNANFGLAETVLFYGVFFFVTLQVIAPVYMTDRRTITALYSMAALFCIAATAWLLLRYPFNFTHLTDVMPYSIRFALNWINYDLGQLLAVALLVGADALILFDMMSYRSKSRSAPR